MVAKSLLLIGAALSFAVAGGAQAQTPQCYAAYRVCLNACPISDDCYRGCDSGYAACLQRFEEGRRSRLTPAPSLLDPGPGGTQAPSSPGTPKPTAPPPGGPSLR